LARGLSIPKVVVSHGSIRLASALSFAAGFLLIVGSAYLGWSWLMLRAAASEWTALEQQSWEAKELYLRSDLTGLCALVMQFLAAWILPHRLGVASEKKKNAGGREPFTYSASLGLWERVAEGWDYFSIRLAFSTLVAAAVIVIHVLVGNIFFRTDQ